MSLPCGPLWLPQEQCCQRGWHLQDLRPVSRAEAPAASSPASPSPGRSALGLCPPTPNTEEGPVLDAPIPNSPENPRLLDCGPCWAGTRTLTLAGWVQFLYSSHQEPHSDPSPQGGLLAGRLVF